MFSFSSKSLKRTLSILFVLLILIFTIITLFVIVVDLKKNEAQNTLKQMINFEKNYSIIANEIEKIETNPNISFFEKKLKIKEKIQPLLKDFYENKSVEQISYYSHYLDMNFNLVKNADSSYFFGSNKNFASAQSNEQKFTYINDGNHNYIRYFYHNGKLLSTVIIKTANKKLIDIIKDILPQIILFSSILAGIMFLIYNKIYYLFRKTLYFYKKHLENFDKRTNYLYNNLLHKKRVPRDLQPAVYNTIIKSYYYEEILKDFSKTASVKDLIPIMAHEVKNPLSVIKGNAQLGKKIKNEKKRDQIFKSIDKNCDLVNRFLNESVQLIRPKENKRKMIKIEEFINDLLLIIEPMIKSKGIKLVKNFEAKNDYLKINRISLNHAIINLIKNAIDASKKGDKIEFKTKVNGDNIEIIIFDNGCGISPEMKNKIFKKYFTTKKEKGTGIGLALAKDIINDHNGKLWFESEMNKGTTFYIKIPKY